MQRTAEPELMTEAEQVLAYANADFEQPHQRFVDLIGERLPRLPGSGLALDLGCGPGDITCRFARAFPGYRVHGLDGSPPMLELARQAAARFGVDDRASFHVCYLPEGDAPSEQYDLVFSNSLLHHLADPAVLWQSVRRWSHRDGAVFVMDLLRPQSTADAARLVDEYSRDEPDVLRRDFYNSLLAAYRPDEVGQQLSRAGLDHLVLEVVSDRHWLVVSP
jgi:ubiquinone/menaquinone biosynthesis C-methylase UbiE